MPGYLIANLDVTDAAKFEQYHQKVVPVIEKSVGVISSAAASCVVLKVIFRSAVW